MLKCSNCEHCSISLSSSGEMLEARCEQLKGKRKAKRITWVSTAVLRPTKILGQYERIDGQVLMREALEKKEKAPNWCPIQQKVEQ